MNVFHLKVAAITTMLIDHIGLFFFPDVLLFRIVGRVSFPIFAWLIANGAHHTRDIKHYLLRLFLFACMSQPFFYLANISLYPTFDRLNVFFTLFLGLAAIIAIQKIRKKFLAIIFILLLAGMAEVIRSDYGAMGVLSIVFFYIFYSNKRAMILAQVFINASLFVTLFFIESEQFYGWVYGYIMQLLSLFSLFLIVKYNGKEGLRAKYLFYVVYPAQYLVIYVLQRIFLH